MQKRFEKYRFDDPKFLKRLSEEVKSKDSLIQGSLDLYRSVREDGSPFDEIIRKLIDLQCEEVLLELDYIDRDYLNEFSAFYSRCFKSYEKRCLRLHFFDKELADDAKGDFGKYSKTSYLGFVVLRPTDCNIVGRTMLKADPTSESRFITCTTKCSSHILGEQFGVDAMPFIQQDTQVGACAHAALWMLVRYMSKRFNLREFLPAEINKLAKSHLQLGREYPADKDGLTSEQILDALREMGFSPLFYEKSEMKKVGEFVETCFPRTLPDTFILPEEVRVQAVNDYAAKSDAAKLADIAYRYIESKLPVIFNFEDHAVVGIGHGYNWQQDAQLAIQRIPSFYIHNDGEGPYLECPLFERRNGYLSFLDVRSIITVTPPTATLSGENAETAARKAIKHLPTLLSQLDSLSGLTIADLLAKANINMPSSDGLEYRTYLLPSVELQMDLRGQQTTIGGLHPQVSEYLLRIDYPRFVWVTEVSCSEFLKKDKKENRRCIGRIISDSTAAKKTNCVMAIHFCDWLVISDRQGKSSDFSCLIDRSTPFSQKFMATSV